MLQSVNSIRGLTLTVLATALFAIPVHAELQASAESRARTALEDNNCETSDILFADQGPEFCTLADLNEDGHNTIEDVQLAVAAFQSGDLSADVSPVVVCEHGGGLGNQVINFSDIQAVAACLAHNPPPTPDGGPTGSKGTPISDSVPAATSGK